MKALVVTTEPCPFPGFPTTGAGLRAWGLAQGLISSGIDAEVAMAADSVAKVDAEAREKVAEFIFEREHLTDHVRSRKPDVLVMQHWGLMNRLGETDLPIAIDLHGPHLLERRYWGSASPEADVREKVQALSRADFLTCAGRLQRHYFLPFAMQTGFDPADPALLGIIPFSVSPDLPEENPRRDPHSLIYSGVFLPWQDPANALITTAKVLEKHESGHLLVIGGPHPTGHVSTGALADLVERLRQSPRVSVKPLRPSAEFEQILTECGAAIDLMARNPERELAFTSRTVCYLAAGLPVLYNDYAELADYIHAYHAGWCVSPDDTQRIHQVISEILDHPEETLRRGRNARRLVAERLTWNRTIAPLAAWCRNPERREKPASLVQNTESLEAELRELRGRRLVRLSQWLRKRGWRS